MRTFLLKLTSELDEKSLLAYLQPKLLVDEKIKSLDLKQTFELLPKPIKTKLDGRK